MDIKFDKKSMELIQNDIDSVNAGAKIKDELNEWKEKCFGAQLEVSKYASELGILKADVSQIFFEVWQLLDGYSGDESWSDWDESVRQKVIKKYKEIINYKES